MYGKRYGEKEAISEEGLFETEILTNLCLRAGVGSESELRKSLTAEPDWNCRLESALKMVTASGSGMFQDWSNETFKWIAQSIRARFLAADQ